MATEEEIEELDVSKKSKLPMILGVVSALLLGGAGGFGAATLTGSGDQVEASGEVAVDPESGEPMEPVDERSILDLGQFTVNLRGAGGGRVLRMEVQVEASASFEESILARKPELRDSVLSLASDYAYADLEGVDGKTRLRDEMLGRINGLLAPERVERIYFTAFVVQ
jgi:flagellar FliL protein